MLRRSSSKMFKIGKKLCFPNVPSTYIPRTVESILHHSQDDDFWNPKPPKDAYLWSFENRYATDNELMDNNLEENYFFLKQGDTFDVISLLKTATSTDDDAAYLVRNNGDMVQVDSLRGKNILVCCVFVPIFWLFSESNGLRALFTRCQQRNANFESETETEMVIVPKMRPNWVADEDAFNHFLSGIPPSCLTVPFSHALHRDHICNSLGLSENTKGLLVDPYHKVVFHKYMHSFGFYEFPFCDPDDSYLWWKKYTQLDSILNLDSRYVFNMIGNDSNMKVSVSQLKQKVVGLYLCFDGSFIRTLDSIYQQCKARNQEFEVVLVYLPYKDGVNPSLFQEAINHVFHNLNISNWWVSPFDDFVSRRLWEAVQFSEEDELVILDPHTNIVDPFAKYVAKCFGVDLYPFTREVLVRRELEAMRAVTLESLLVYGSRNHVLCIDDDNNVKQVPIAQLRGKIVFLYIEDIHLLRHGVDEKLLDWYNWIKTTRAADDFEVVLVSKTPFDNSKSLPVSIPWLVCPFDLQHTKLVTRKTLTMDYRGILVAFGKDGHIIELNAQDRLNKYGPEDFPSDDGLCKEIICHLQGNYEIDMNFLFPDWYNYLSS